ncbi:gamma-glutamyl-gamma-aminobutyrate hydrolase family protein [Candidatus Pelagibacter sp.]|nr:gamma-glutamyl-gamma-aminobutyrate hydrolase family protein [Candidatus Pelagibacter sp.]
MKNFIVSTKLEVNSFGTWISNYDMDTQKFLDELNIGIFPYLQNKNKISKKTKMAKGLILMGGGDLYSLNKKKEFYMRDQIEKRLYREFFKSNKPIIGICRGFQLIMNYYDIPLVKRSGHVRKNHNLEIKKSKFINCKSLTVNSFHNYVIEKVPNNFNIISKSKDGSIEIAEHKRKKILCLMFHPERKMKSKKNIMKSLKDFIK